jgi:hypothetical protein
MMSKTVHTLLASIGLCLSGVAGAVDSWDAVGDFNHMSGNPNPPQQNNPVVPKHAATGIDNKPALLS